MFGRLEVDVLKRSFFGATIIVSPLAATEPFQRCLEPSNSRFQTPAENGSARNGERRNVSYDSPFLSGGDGWHVRDLQRAAVAQQHEAEPVDFRRLFTSVAADAEALSGFDAVIVRTMPPGSLEQVVFRMDLLHRLQARWRPRAEFTAAVGDVRR